MDNICRRTVLFGADVDLVAAHSVSCSGEGQHLDTVVGVFFQTLQLQRDLLCSDISDFPQFCGAINKKAILRLLKTCCQLMVADSAEITLK